ncbi:MAG TPA: LysR substrate-binding domain-containing protein [Solimonas sp.]
MELRHLRYFVAVAEELHFTRAARRLGMNQPPLSQQIQQLERELGATLFQRAARGVTLTPAGHAFLEDARRLLRDASLAGERARRVAQGEQGRLRLGMINSAPFHPLIPRVIREFRRRYPGVTLSLQEDATPALAAAVGRDTLDAAFVRPLLEPVAGLREQIVLEEDLVVALPAGHALSAKPALALLALSLEPFVLFSRSVGAGLHDEITGACRKAGFAPRIVQEASQVTSIVNLVASGLGVSLVPASMQRMNTEGVAFRPLRKPVPKARLLLMHRADDAQSAQLRNLLALTQQLAASTKREREF